MSALKNTFFNTEWPISLRARLAHLRKVTEIYVRKTWVQRENLLSPKPWKVAFSCVTVSLETSFMRH
jgi:hypothetical protein